MRNVILHCECGRCNNTMTAVVPYNIVEEYQAKVHLCTKCKNTIASLTEVHEVSNEFLKNAVHKNKEAFEKYKNTANWRVEELKDKLKGKVIKYHDNEYEVNDVSWHDGTIYLDVNKINSIKKYSLNNSSRNTLWLSEDVLSDIIITDEIFAHRANRITTILKRG